VSPCPTRPLYDEAAADYEAFWARQARELLTWDTDFHTTLEWELPFAKWFVGGELNVAYNCLDRHVEAGRGDKVAFHWEGEPGDTRTITYADLLARCSASPTCCKGLGVEQGDRVCIYMPMIPELVVAMLACARIGAAHSVVFGGFSPTRSSTGSTTPRPRRRDHRRRRLPPGRAVAAQAQRRRRARRLPDGRARRGRRPLRHRGRHGPTGATTGGTT
jgi:hypothetical protein